MIVACLNQMGVALAQDRIGRPLPVWQGCRRLAASQVFLMNPRVPDSFDGRYFGPLLTSSIVGRAVPLWTDEDGDGRFTWRAVPEHWIRAVIRVESRGAVRPVSPAGAMGLMQIMPGTWAELRVRYRFGADPFDPRDNILAGTAYLREMYDRYGSPGFLAAYNAGPGRYEDYVARGRALPAETRAYVAVLAPLVGGGDITRPATVIAVAGPSR